MNCPTCHHKEHEPGECKQDNCGSSELIRAPYGHGSNYNGDGNYVSGAIYNRNRQPREAFKKRGAEGSKRHPGRID